MELVKLKMRKIYKFCLIFIGLLVLVCIFLGLFSFYHYKYNSADSDIEVYDNLSINFNDGKNISVANNKKITLSITNNGDTVVYFNIAFLKVRGSGDYVLSSDDIVASQGNLNTSDEINTSDISIDVNETKNYVLEVENSESTDLTFTLSIRNMGERTTAFRDLILSNTDVASSSLTKVGVEIATDDEGLIKSSDDVGVSYYFRGNVKNNYVSFADLTWRIVRINGDGTVRIVLDDVTDSVSTYYDDENDFSYSSSMVADYLKSWFETNLDNYNDYIAMTKFCSDMVANDEYVYNAYVRIITNKIPTLNCLGESFMSNIGLLTIDEVIFAGASPDKSNTSFYLYNSAITDYWYTMTGAKGSSSYLNLFMISSNGSVTTNLSGNLYREVRPVINLIQNINMTGSGTISDPYRLAE